MKENFINYAHRGASEYMPENTISSFCVGLYMGANGIETDVQLTKDGKAVLFHDDTLKRVTGEEGEIADYTYEELQKFNVRKNEFTDKILLVEDFFKFFSYRDLTFAIELKNADAAEITAQLIKKYNMDEKVVVTSFKYDAIQRIRACAPHLKTGYLAFELSSELQKQMLSDGIYEICPEAKILTKENVADWHEKGFNVRAWGVLNEDLMKYAVECGVDGMTVNFPDKLTEYLKNN